MHEDLIRNFAGYRNQPPAIRWPDGKQLALSIVINIEEGAELSIGMGDEATRGAQPAP